MTQKELWKEFSKQTRELLDLLSSLSQEQMNTVPFEGSWTAGQLGDHLLKSYGLSKVLDGKTVATERPVDEKIKKIRELFLNFDIKFKSPEFIVPGNGPMDKEKLLKGLEDKIRYVSAFIESHDDLSRTCLDAELPGAGTLTQTEWVQFMTVHTQRHVHQLKNMVKKLEYIE
jgi:uncharacterized damage-inducible protein DinB